MITPFKFLQKDRKEILIDMMNDEYHLEEPATRLMRPFTLNVFTDVLGRIPTYLTAIELSNIDDYEVIRGTTIGQLTSGELNIPWCFTELSITRISDNSHVSIHYHNVDEMDRRALIFDPQDRVTICYKPN